MINKPNSKFQKYRLTDKGNELKIILNSIIEVPDQDTVQDTVQVTVQDTDYKTKIDTRYAEVTGQVTEQVTGQVTGQVTEQVKKFVMVIDGELSSNEIMKKLELKGRANFISEYLQPALKTGFVEMTFPNKPNSKFQKYRLSAMGKELKNVLNSKK